ncbi:MAG: type II secretion system F family protein [Candidatus Paceibacterota bacterium]|jgi:type IV pilus assembly protein PilC
MKFKYQARSKDGELQVGFVDAPSQEDAVRVLSEHELFVLSIASEEKGAIGDRFFQFFNRVKTKDLMIFTRQMATLMEAEIPLEASLQALEKQTKNPILKETIFQIRQDVESGLSFSQALERQGEIFSVFYINMIRSAEVTGRLQEAMLFLGAYMEKENEWQSKIIGSLTYPAILMGLFLVVMGIMVGTILPKIMPVFQESGVDLPLVSKIIFGAGSIMLQWWWAVLVIVVVAVFALLDYFKSDEGRMVWGRLVFFLPVFGSLFKKIYIARFAQSLSTLLKGGIPVAQAIEIAGSTIGNPLYREIFQISAQGIREGKLFSEILAQEEKFFPSMVSQMIAVGESTGRLDEMLLRVASFYEREADQTMDNLSELIQPLFILLIGGMIGLLFAAILLPIYNLAQSFQM